jgi:hypothetical protein
MEAQAIKPTFAIKGDLTTTSYTSTASTLVAVFVDKENRYWYAIDDQQIIRKMSITRDVEHARREYKIARNLVGKKVHFGVTQGWDSNVWFNEVVEA